MKVISLLHLALVTLFALLNSIMLYLFLMHLPYGFEPLVASFRHWDALQPDIGIYSSLCAVLAVGVSLIVPRILDMWKNRLLYFRWYFPHPAFNAFLCTRKQPFESKALLAAFPEVKDSGFSARVQTEVWKRLDQEYRDTTVIVNTRLHWHMLRDIFIVSLFFLDAFVLGWLYNWGIPFELVSTYVFLFGAQSLFLLFAARRVGLRYVDNVLGVALEGSPSEPTKKPNKKKR